ncbi:hypothetical protein SAMN05216567_13622 [Variovorax sp. OK605]|nr:hypothetical protein SAMN05216567_13622 [Variovorax sp. OK605]
MRMLLIEDDPMLADMIQEALEGMDMMSTLLVTASRDDIWRSGDTTSRCYSI